MKRSLNSKQLKELKYIYEWCKTIQLYINAHNEDCFDKGLMQELDPEYAEQNPSLHDYLIRVLDRAYAEQNLVGLRASLNDYNETASDLPLEQFEELNQILREKFGEDLVHNRQKELAKIKRIVNRGKINNENEYRLIKSRIEEIINDENRVTEIHILDGLLNDFEETINLT
jgi:hypothetical protein